MGSDIGALGAGSLASGQRGAGNILASESRFGRQTSLADGPGFDEFKRSRKSSAQAAVLQPFSVAGAMKSFGKGLISPLTVFIQHPVAAIGGLAAGIVACSLVPALVPVLAIGFGAYSVYQAARGGVHAYQRYQSGDAKGAERAFEDIGAGVIGAAMGVLGLRSTGAVAAEAKATKAAVEAGKSVEEVLQAGQAARRQARTMSQLEALKENASIISGKEGRATLLEQLKPGSIRKKLLDIVEYFRKPASQKFTQVKTTEASEFSLSVEGLRRAKLTRGDIAASAESSFNAACDELGIPVELRPKLNVQDELRFRERSEIEAMARNFIEKKARLGGEKYRNASSDELPQAEIFAEGETPVQFTNAELDGRIRNALNKAFDEMKVPAGERLSSYEDFGHSDYIGGNYKAGKHEVNYHANSYRKGIMTVDEVMAHEARHAEQAILRMQLAPEERASIVREELAGFIRNGETEEILHRAELLGLKMMEPPRMNAFGKMRDEVAALFEELVYPHAEKLTQELPSYQKSPGGPGSELARALESRLGAIVDENPAFLNQYEGDRAKAVSHLMKYAEAHSLRYQLFSQPEIRDAALAEKIAGLPLSAERRAEAVQSLKDTIPTLEGNGRTQGFINRFFGPSDEAFNQYQFSPEEVLARNTAAGFERRRVEAELAALGESSESALQRKALETRLEELDFEVRRNGIGEAMYKTYNRYLNEPDNPAVLEEMNRLKAEYKICKDRLDAMHDRLKDKTTHDVVTEPYPIRNGANVRGWDDYEDERRASY